MEFPAIENLVDLGCLDGCNGRIRRDGDVAFDYGAVFETEEYAGLFFLGGNLCQIERKKGGGGKKTYRRR